MAETRVVNQGELLNQDSNHPSEESNSFFRLANPSLTSAKLSLIIPGWLVLKTAFF